MYSSNTTIICFEYSYGSVCKIVPCNFFTLLGVTQSMLETVVPKGSNAAVMLVGRKRKGQVKKKSGVFIINQNLICKYNNFM